MFGSYFASLSFFASKYVPIIITFNVSIKKFLLLKSNYDYNFVYTIHFNNNLV